jgi:tellurite resistance protein TehA-like permease
MIDALDRTLSAIPPASGAVVMGTGIVSVALSTAHQHALSLALLAVAATTWLALGLLLVARVLRDRSRVWREASSPAALTGVAATAVLGARATGLGWSGVAIALLVIGSGLWLGLLAPVLCNWRTKSTGVSFMVTVSTQSLSVLAAQLAVREHAAWLLYVSLAVFALGLALYLFVLASFEFRQLLDGQGDHWVSGGALAISTLAAARIAIGADLLHVLSPSTLRTLSVVLWACSAAWLPALVITEALRPRLGYDVRRWATVFPLGMYAACSFDAGRAASIGGLTDFAHVWVWIGFAGWCLVFAAMVWRGRELLTGRHPLESARRVEEVASER